MGTTKQQRMTAEERAAQRARDRTAHIKRIVDEAPPLTQEAQDFLRWAFATYRPAPKTESRLARA